MSRMTVQQCKQTIDYIAWRYGVSYNFVDGLLSADDKRDMIDGKLPTETLAVAVEVTINKMERKK